MDELVLKPTLSGATMTEVEFMASSLAPFFSTIQPSEGNMSMLSPGNVSCSSHIREVNVSEFDYPYRLETWVPITWREVLKIMACVIIFLVSLIGNLMVILVVYFNVHMRTSTNQYLVNLAAADLLVTLVCLWVHMVRHLSHPNYILPVLACKLESFVQATSLLASVLTLTVISVGRFVAVLFPLHARTSPDRPHRVIAAVWITSALLACPTLLYKQYYSIQWANYTSWQCDEIWPSVSRFDPLLGYCVKDYNLKVLFYTIFIIALYFLPVGIMIINYSLVVWRLWVTQMPGEHWGPSRHTVTRAKQKVVKMVSAVLVVFVLCWTPLQSIILYSNFFHEDYNSLPSWFPSMEFAAYFIAYSNSALNPIIYCGFNANFRQGFVALLNCRPNSAGRIYHPRSKFRSTVGSERKDSAGNWRGMAGTTRDTTLASTGPEPAILLEFNSLKKNKNGQKNSRSIKCHDNYKNSLSDSGSDHKSVPGDTINETTPANNEFQNPKIHRSTDSTVRGVPLQRFGLNSRRGSSLSTPRGSLSGSKSSGHSKGLVDCCCPNRKKTPGHRNSYGNNHQRLYAVNEVRDNISNDTKEDML